MPTKSGPLDVLGFPSRAAAQAEPVGDDHQGVHSEFWSKRHSSRPPVPFLHGSAPQAVLRQASCSAGMNMRGEFGFPTRYHSPLTEGHCESIIHGWLGKIWRVLLSMKQVEGNRCITASCIDLSR
ncbi:unnamed protein product [Discosporangium mesarthrocarpum]